MEPSNTRTDPDTGRASAPKAVAAAGALAVVALCCGAHALVLGALGGLAIAGVLGIGAGVLAAILLVTALLVARRRRAPMCDFKVDRRERS